MKELKMVIQQFPLEHHAFRDLCGQFFSALMESFAVKVEVIEQPRGLVSRRSTNGLVHEERTEDVIFTVAGDYVAEIVHDVGKIFCRFNTSLLNHGLHWLVPFECQNTSLDFRHIDVLLNKFTLGTFVLPNNFVGHFTYKEVKCIYANFLHDEREFVLFFKINHPVCGRKEPYFYKLELRYDHIIRVFVHETESAFHLYLNYYLPPLLFVLRGKGANFYDLINQDMRFVRVTAIECAPCKNKLCGKATLGNCTTIKLSISNIANGRCILNRLQRMLVDNANFIYSALVHTRKGQLTLPPAIVVNDFQCHDCFYSWTCASTADFQVQDQLGLQNSKGILSLIQAYERRNHMALQKTFFTIFDFIQHGQIFEIFRMMRSCFNYHSALFETIPEGIFRLPRLILTPYKKIFCPFQQQLQNRMLLKFNPELFLMVSIRENDLEKIFNITRRGDFTEFMNSHFREDIEKGIRVGKRVYKFLAGSNSQLREQAFYMYAEVSSSISADSIRKWIRLDNIKGTAAKKLSRMGQCFSSLEAVVPLPEDCDIVTAPDITSRGHNGVEYIFTDGIGMVSSALVDEICDVIASTKTTDPTYRPCAFQIRFCGFKGMLVENPELKGREIIFRESMKKFSSTFINQLEIIKTSAPTQLYLNRFLITILEQKGIRREVFQSLQDNMISEMTECLIYDRQAAELLEAKCKFSLPFVKLYHSGFSLTSEPFFRSLLISTYSDLICLLRTKTRIAIPADLGRNMLGVFDETRKLGEDQVFVQYSESVVEPATLRILEGPVVVTKNPGLHPGDVRLVEAVDIPELHHIRDCVVFPSQGPRPLTDQIAGSDLDGDEYVVLWHPDLIGIHNDLPMDYPHLMSQQQQQNDDTSVGDMINYILHSIKKNKIGQCAYSYLALADMLEDGIYSEPCLAISKKYPFVLDYLKSGCDLDVRDLAKPVEYPDFMEKGTQKPAYRSRRVLGQLYRSTRILLSTLALAESQEAVVKHDPLLAYPGWQEYEMEALEKQDVYSHKLQGILQSLGISTEEECLSGHVTFQKFLSQSEREHLVNLLERNIRNLQKSMEETFFISLSDYYSKPNFVEVKYRKASAWYMVTYTTQAKTKLLGFPWCISHVLCDVRQSMCKLNQSMAKPVTSHLLDTIEEKLQQIKVEDTYGDNEVDVKVQVAKKTLQQHWLQKSPEFNRSWIRYFDDAYQEFLKTQRYLPDDLMTATLIMNFLGWAAGTSLSRLPNLRPEFSKHIQKYALQTYTSIPLTMDLRDLGLDMGVQWRPLSSKIRESNVIRMPLASHQDLKRWTRVHRGLFKELLMQWSGVEQVEVREDDNSLYIVGQGHDLQCWQLEEVALHPLLYFALVCEDIGYLY